MVVPFKYEMIKFEHFGAGFIVMENNRWGFVNNNGKVMVKPLYDKLQVYHSGATVVATKNNKDALLSRKGKIILPFELKK